jgi:hypothetical protein
MSENVLYSRRAETVIDDNCGLSKFYSIATTLSNDLQVRFLNQVDEVESMDWDFHYKQHLLTLHFDVYGGVSIIDNEFTPRTAAAREELGQYLRTRVF